jgi:hypothetical protein
MARRFARTAGVGALLGLTLCACALQLGGRVSGAATAQASSFAPAARPMQAAASVQAARAVRAARTAQAPRVSLRASFTPDRLATPTTIFFEFTVARDGGRVPPPLTHVLLRLPAGMSYATSDLGLAICQPKALVEKGLAGCSPNSRLGQGSAFVEVPFGSSAGQEIPEIDALMGPPHDGNVVVLFYANGRVPVFAQIVFSAEVLPGGGPFGMTLDTTIPLIESVPGGPPVSILRVSSTIGPGRLVYYKRVHGRRVAYHPHGIEVPERCPRGGFPFQAQFQFVNGARAETRTAVPCPRARRRK